ncbi:MAG: MBG domain-containing protein, partial [Candidatus Methanomethylophilaceae archaeon]
QEGVDYTVSWNATPLAAGTYTATVTGTGNYSGEQTAAYVISKKSVTVRADDVSKTYGNADPEFTAMVAGNLNDDPIVYTLTRTDGENVGEYVITPSGAAEQGNYAVSFVNGTFVITVYEGMLVTVPDASSYIYTGHPIEPGVTVTDRFGNVLVPAEDFNVSYADNTDPGTASIIVTGTGNYEGTVSSASFEIESASVPVTVPQDIGDVILADAEGNPIMPGDEISTGEIITVTPENPPVGGYVITDAEGNEVSADGTYTVAENFAPFTVTPTHTVAEVPVPVGGLSYNKTEQTGVFDGEGFSLYGEITGTNAGTYEAYATLDEGYVWPDGTFGDRKIVWEIAKAKVVPPGVIVLTPDEVKNGYFPGRDVYEVVLSSPVPGSYSGMINLLDKDNYQWSDGTDDAKNITVLVRNSDSGMQMSKEPHSWWIYILCACLITISAYFYTMMHGRRSG